MNQAHLAQLSEDFDLGPNPIAEENHEGVLNRNYVVTTDTGTYFVKSIREKRKSSLPYIAETEEFFFQKGIPVIRMLLSRNGRKFETYDSETYTVYPFIESVKTHVYNDADFSRMGEMLGRIHSAGSNDIPATLQQKSFDEKPLNLILDKLHMYKERVKIPHDDTDRLFSEYIELKIEMLNHVQHSDVLSMDTLTHGDYHARNLLFSPDRDIIGVLDWEQAAMNARAYEIARSVLYVCFEDEGDSRESIKSAQSFVRGYVSSFPIPHDELIAGFRSRWNKLVHSFWIEEQYFDRNDVRSNKFIPHEMKLIRDFADDELIKMLMD